MPRFINSDGVAMPLYKKLACSNLSVINQEILEYIQIQKFQAGSFWNPVDILDFIKATPAFTTWWLDNQLPIKSVAITCGTKIDCCLPHTDTPPSRYKLSWPVLNTEHTWNRWFQPLPSSPKQVNTLGGISYTDPTAMIEIDRMRVDSPALITTDVPHDVWFEPEAQFPRWGLQCQLFTEPAHL